jgi:hypothetical protein
MNRVGRVGKRLLIVYIKLYFFIQIALIRTR